MRLFTLFFFLAISLAQGQERNFISLDVKLNDSLHELEIIQKIDLILSPDFDQREIWFHNWPNAYKDNKTPLAKRFLENYSNNFHFSSDKSRGETNINSIIINGENCEWEVPKDSLDLLKVRLTPQMSLQSELNITLTYKVKLPRDRFTGYGWSKNRYNLKFWYLSPAIYRDGNWTLMSNLDLNDLMIDFSDYKINFDIPQEYLLFSDLDQQVNYGKGRNIYTLKGKNRLNIEIALSKYLEYQTINTAKTDLVTNMEALDLNPGLMQNIADRQLLFLEEFVGELDRETLFINKLDYLENPVYGFNQLPNFLAPFQDSFLWDIKFLKVLSKRYLEEYALNDKRNDYWLNDATQTWIMMEYINKYYPDAKALGKVSNLPIFRNYYLANLGFNDKYLTIYQYIARQNLDQALNTPAQDLSNFNRKITNKYKGGMGLNFLNEYLGEDTVKKQLKEYYSNGAQTFLSTSTFENQLNSNGNLNWFFQDYIQTDKHIDFKLSKVENDSTILIQNKSKFDLPFTVNNLNKYNILDNTWVTSDSLVSVKPRPDADRIGLNQNRWIPEVNFDNNTKKKKRSLLNKPVDFKLFRDLNNPNKNQIFYSPEFGYNFYDGFILGAGFSNRTILPQNFLFKITPSYGIKGKTLTGSFSTSYRFMPKETSIQSFRVGITGSYFHYAPDLGYRKLTPYVAVNFKRKNLRDVGGKSISASFVKVDKDPNPNSTEPGEVNKYNVLNLNYSYSKPALIDDLRYNVNLQLEGRFIRTSLDFRYRRLTDRRRQFDFRFFTGVFLKNNTESDYFSFALDRPTNYLFNYNFLGTSETSGFFSQQIIIAEGGFKSNVGQPYANQWMTTFNTSVGLWRWIEVYGDIGFVKNKKQPVFFGYDGGIRLNFIHNILEVYFPLYANSGWQVGQEGYPSKIRFVLTLDPGSILSFFRRGVI